jgi:acyl-CoA synthetase (AMP-forming)/AMP-acid ligase II
MHDLTLYDLFQRNASLHGDRPALQDNRGKMTYRELADRTAVLARALSRHGLTKGDRVAILANNSEAYFLVMGAAACLGAILVPLNWRLAVEELHHIITDAEPAWIFFDEAHAASIAQLGDLPGFPANQTPLETLPAFMATAPDAVTGDGQAVSIAGDDPYCLIYTAAVEGRSRGAVLSHHNFIYSNIQTIATLGLSAQDTYLNMLPLFHITGLNLALSVLHAGGLNVIMERFEPQRALDWTENARVSLLGSFPPILSKLMEALDQKPRDLSSLKHILGLDHPDAIAAFEQRTGGRFWTLYGQTETSGFVTLSPVSENPGSAGRQGLLTKYRIVDAQDRELPAGETGEILVRGPLVFQGFWQQASYNERIFRNGWLHTGDLGSLDTNGTLWFKGRKPEKELIKPGGENVYPAEVEAAVMAHEAIADVAVIGVPDPKFGEGVKAVCVLQNREDGSARGTGGVRRGIALRAIKSRAMSPLSTSLPKQADGATDRNQVKALYSTTITSTPRFPTGM